MKILLDHNVPHGLRTELAQHEVHTAAYQGWDELENGDLLEAAASHGYHMLITCDQGIPYEQDLNRYDVTLVTIMNGDWNVIRQNIDRVSERIETAVPGQANPIYFPP